MAAAPLQVEEFRPADTLDKHCDLGEGLVGYRWGNLIVAPGIPDRMLAHHYERFEREGLLPLIFHEGQQSLFGFLKEYLNPNTYTLGAYVVTDSGWAAAGMGWINRLAPVGDRFVQADVGHAFFREHWHGNRAVRCAQMMIEWGWDNLQIDVLRGVTPAANRAAVIFAHKLKFQVVGPVEAGCDWQGQLAPAHISTMSRQMWAGRRPWKE